MDFLQIMWDKTLSNIKHHAQVFNDPSDLCLLDKIENVPEELRQAVFSMFLRKCLTLYTVAFLEFRL